MAKPVKGRATDYMVLRNEPKHDDKEAAILALWEYYDFHKRMQQESEMSPEELVRGTPELLVRYEFVPTLSAGTLDVKRWERGSYYYLGSIVKMADETWAPYALAPVGNSRHKWILSIHREDQCPTREEAAQRLWGIYKAEKDSAEQK